MNVTAFMLLSNVIATIGWIVKNATSTLLLVMLFVPRVIVVISLHPSFLAPKSIVLQSFSSFIEIIVVKCEQSL